MTEDLDREATNRRVRRMLKILQDRRPPPRLKVRFKPNNNIVYMQDFCFLRNIPHGIVFDAEPIGKERLRWKLISPGYGKHGDYGNGAIFVNLNVK